MVRPGTREGGPVITPTTLAASTALGFAGVTAASEFLPDGTLGAVWEFAGETLHSTKEALGPYALHALGGAAVGAVTQFVSQTVGEKLLHLKPETQRRVDRWVSVVTGLGAAVGWLAITHGVDVGGAIAVFAGAVAEAPIHNNVIEPMARSIGRRIKRHNPARGNRYVTLGGDE